MPRSLAVVTFPHEVDGGGQTRPELTMTTFLLSAFAVLDLAAGLYSVRYSGGAERKRPEVVLLVGVRLVLAAGFLMAVVVRLRTWPGMVRERATAGVVLKPSAA